MNLEERKNTFPSVSFKVSKALYPTKDCIKGLSRSESGPNHFVKQGVTIS